jgi:hypothetical protein
MHCDAQVTPQEAIDAISEPYPLGTGAPLTQSADQSTRTEPIMKPELERIVRRYEPRGVFAVCSGRRSAKEKLSPERPYRAGHPPRLAR